MITLLAKTAATFIAAIASTAAFADNVVRPPAAPDGGVQTQEVQQAKVESWENPGNGWRYVGGEAVWELQSGRGGEGKTRAQVRNELTAYQNDSEQQQRHDRFYQPGA